MQDREIELKFLLPETAAGRLHELPALSGAIEAERLQQTTTYFDTPAFALDQKGLVCRIRAIDGKRLQTIKASSSSGIARHEWECAIEGDRPQLDLLPKARANAALRKAAISNALAPVFVTEIERRSWMISRGAALIEVSLDRGQIVAHHLSHAVCEVEIELKSGSPQDLFALAQELAAQAPLRLDLNPKSRVGYRLAAGHDDVDTDPALPKVTPDMSLGDGFRALCMACLRHFMINEPVLRATREVEALHQTRTAIRRLRALLRVFGRHVKDDELAELRDGFKWLSRVLGAARDLDVMGAHFAAHRKTAHLSANLDTKRDVAYARVFEALDSERFRKLLLDFCAWLEIGPWTTTQPRKRSRGTFEDICMLEFMRWDRKLLAHSADIDGLDPEERHDIRIRAKSLLYVCGLSQGAVPRSRHKAFSAYQKALKRLQSILGKLNDAHVAREQLRETLGEGSRRQGDASNASLDEAARHAVARHAKKEDRLLRDAVAAQAQFAAAPRIWADD